MNSSLGFLLKESGKKRGREDVTPQNHPNNDYEQVFETIINTSDHEIRSKQEAHDFQHGPF